MVDFLTHYYKAGTLPFRSLSVLPDAEAIAIMQTLYDDQNVLMVRFGDPEGYLKDRRLTEAWVRQQFISKNGCPQASYPHYMILGRSKWVEQHLEPGDGKVQIPISEFSEAELSFTYPDSMISFGLANDKPDEWSLPNYYGEIFTLSEILAIVEECGMPEESWETNLPQQLASYIEAQIWNHEPLKKYQTVE